MYNTYYIMTLCMGLRFMSNYQNRTQIIYSEIWCKIIICHYHPLDNGQVVSYIIPIFTYVYIAIVQGLTGNILSKKLLNISIYEC